MTELVVQTLLEPFAKRGRWVVGCCKHSSQAQAVVALALLHQGPADCFHFCYIRKNGSVGLTRCGDSSLQLLPSLSKGQKVPVSVNVIVNFNIQ